MTRLGGVDLTDIYSIQPQGVYSDPLMMGVYPDPLNMGVVVPGTGGFTDDFNRANSGSIGGSWDAAFLLFSPWYVKNAGGASWSISSNQLVGSQINPQIAYKTTMSSSPKMYGAITNKTVLTGTGSRQFRIIINMGRPGDSYSSYYYGAMGQDGSGSYISIGKNWNAADFQFVKSYVPIPVDTVFKFKHDGNGGLFIELNGVQTLFFQDWCPLRAMGGGIGHVNGNGYSGFTVDNADFGPWEVPITTPSPLRVGDAIDTDTFTSGLWTKDLGGSSAMYISTSLTYGGHIAGPNNEKFVLNTTGLSADQFCEIGHDGFSSVKQTLIWLRSANTSSGYYFGWRSTATFTGVWDIGRVGVGIIASSGAMASAPAGRLRAEISGTTLRLYTRDAGNNDWVLQVSTTDSNISAANNIRINPNGVGGQGIPVVHDILAGNLATTLTCTINKTGLSANEPVVGAPITFEAQFSEDVTGLTTGDIVLSGSGSAGASVASVSPTITGTFATSRAFTITVTGMTGNGDVTATIPASCCVAQTHGGMSNQASTSTDNTVTYLKFNPVTLISWAHAYWAEGTEFKALSLADGAAVSNWPDEIGTADATQATGTAQPIYRASGANWLLPCIDFDGGDTLVSGTWTTIGVPRTLVIVFYADNISGADRTFVDANTHHIGIQVFESRLRHGAGTTVTGGSGGSFISNMKSCFRSYITSGADVLTREGGIVTSADAGSANSTAISIGGNLDGRIVFVGMYNGDATADSGWANLVAGMLNYYGVVLG